MQAQVLHGKLILTIKEAWTHQCSALGANLPLVGEHCITVEHPLMWPLECLLVREVPSFPQMNKRVIVREPRASAFNVEFCLYGTHVSTYARHGQLSWSLVSHTITATTCAYVLPSPRPPS